MSLITGYGTTTGKLWTTLLISCCLVPSDFSFFGPLKMHLAGKWFAPNADVRQAVTSWLETLDVRQGCNLLARDTWHCCLLCWATVLGAALGHIVMWVLAAWRSDVYNLLLICHVCCRSEYLSPYWRDNVYSFFLMGVHHSSTWRHRGTSSYRVWRHRRLLP